MTELIKFLTEHPNMSWPVAFAIIGVAASSAAVAIVFIRAFMLNK